MTDCTFTLLPKPNKPLRRPQDLRPLGLQDPSSKVLAGLVRNRLFQQVQGWLMSKLQFAYAEGRSIDETTTLSIDLTRAFDTIPRKALSCALKAAGVTGDLHDLVMDLHMHCRYEIRHGSFEGHFEMQCGVRQGCALSLTAWLYDQIAARTNASWARDFNTMYADDTVLQWHVQRIRDLNFMCECA